MGTRSKEEDKDEDEEEACSGERTKRSVWADIAWCCKELCKGEERVMVSVGTA